MKGKKPTLKQKRFAKKYLETGNATEAAMQNYNVKSREVAKVVGSENLTKPNVRKLIESYADKAALRIQELSEQGKHLPVALGASKDILDRAGFKPPETNVNFNLDLIGKFYEEVPVK